MLRYAKYQISEVILYIYDFQPYQSVEISPFDFRLLISLKSIKRLCDSVGSRAIEIFNMAISSFWLTYTFCSTVCSQSLKASKDQSYCIISGQRTGYWPVSALPGWIYSLKWPFGFNTFISYPQERINSMAARFFGFSAKVDPIKKLHHNVMYSSCRNKSFCPSYDLMLKSFYIDFQEPDCPHQDGSFDQV
jgi:hypothetical protein